MNFRKLLSQRLKWFNAASLVVLVIQWGWSFFALHAHPDKTLFRSILGSPPFFGYSEVAERWEVIVLILATSLAAILTTKFWDWAEEKTAFAFEGLLAQAVVISSCILVGRESWSELLLVAALVAVAPWGLFVKLPRWTAPRPESFVAAASLSFYFCAIFYSPWNSQPEYRTLDFLKLLGTFSVFLLSFSWALKKFPENSRWRQCYLLGILTLPIFPFLRTVVFVASSSLLNNGVDSHPVIPVLVAIFSAFILGFSKLDSDRLSRLCRFSLRWVSVPLLIYALAFEMRLYGRFDPWHEGDIFAASKALLLHAVPYRDVFIPHGVGNALIGTLGMFLGGASISAFRTFYALLVPLNWCLTYLAFALFVPSLALSTGLAFAAAAISGLNNSYEIAQVSWYGGIRNLAPMVTLIVALWGIRKRYGSKQTPGVLWSLLLGIGVASSLFLNVERAAATASFSILTLVLVSKDSLKSLGKNLLTILGSFLAFSFALWSPFGDLPEITKGIFRHLFEFTQNHSSQWGLPLFSFSMDTSTNYMLYASLPLLAVALGLAVFSDSQKRKDNPAITTSLLPLSLFTFCMFQLGVSRSDYYHLWVGMGVTGMVLLLIVYLLNDRKSLVIALVIALLTGGLVNSPTEWAKNLVRKRQLPDRQLKAWNPELEGAHPVLTSRSVRLLTAAEAFMQAHPLLNTHALLLMEEGSLLKLFLNFKDADPFTMHHYIITPEDQKKVIANLVSEDADTVWINKEETEFEGFPRALRMPILMSYVYTHYFPCETLGDVTVLAKSNCRSKSEDHFSRLFSDMDLGHIPAILARSEPGDLKTLEFVRVHIEKAPKNMNLALSWGCSDVYSNRATRKITWTSEENQSDYSIPVATSAAWKYCRNAPHNLNLVDEAAGTRVNFPFSIQQSPGFRVIAKVSSRSKLTPSEP